MQAYVWGILGGGSRGATTLGFTTTEYREVNLGAKAISKVTEEKTPEPEVSEETKTSA